MQQKLLKIHLHWNREKVDLNYGFFFCVKLERNFGDKQLIKMKVVFI